MRKDLHGAIQATAPDDEDLEGGVLIGWVVVAEWMSPDGERWISKQSGANNGDESPPLWHERGYLAYALDRMDGNDEE